MKKHKNLIIFIAFIIVLIVIISLSLGFFNHSTSSNDEHNINNDYEPVINKPEKTIKDDTVVDEIIDEVINDESAITIIPKRVIKKKKETKVVAGVAVGDDIKVPSYDNGKNDDNKKIISPLDKMTLAKINQIRNTSNTDISKRTGKVIYVSNDGNDNNDGLSKQSAIKSLAKLSTMLNSKAITSGDTVLFRDGDTFRGDIKIVSSDILLGSYGDISKGKPKLYRSLYDGAKEGKWIEVKKNIWKYQINDSDPFNNDVGTMWFFCDKENNNCTESMDSVDRKFSYAKKILTDKSYDETNIEDNIDSILKNDLEFYHVGHSTVSINKGKAIYLYSTSNPAERFDEIEFNAGAHVIYTVNTPLSSLNVDNLYIAFTGGHGISIGKISNLKVTNCEIAFIGGGILSYDNSGKPTRYGNAVQVYGSIVPVDNVQVDDGFIVDNSYIYQVYDTGVTAQYSTSSEMRMDKITFSNNVIEYCNWNIEYWNRTTSKDENVINNSNIGDFYINNNILRHSGYGISQTRSDLGNSANIMTWQHAGLGFNRIKGEFIIENNTLEDAYDQHVSIKSSLHSDLPVIRNNIFYGNSDTKFGHYYSENEIGGVYTFGYILDRGLFKDNNFILEDTNNYKSLSGGFGSVNWSFDAKTHKLSLTGDGVVPDFQEGTAPWYSVRNSIYRIYIGDGITTLGNYSFYNLTRVNTIEFNANLSDFSWSSSDANAGTNFIFYKVGHDDYGVDLIIGSNVKKIPRMFGQPSNINTDAPAIRNIIFTGNNLQELRNYSITKYKNTAIKIPEGVKTITQAGLGNSDYLKLIILPSTLTDIRDWSLTSNTALNKLVVAGPIASFGGSSLFYNRLLTTIVVPHIDKPEVYSGYQFNYASGALTIYGDSSVEAWINNILNDSKNTKKNVTFKNISEYTSKITSNSDISGSVGFKESFTFTTDKNVKAYYILDNNKFALADLVKDGNTYTINDIVSDIYIEVE